MLCMDVYACFTFFSFLVCLWEGCGASSSICLACHHSFSRPHDTCSLDEFAIVIAVCCIVHRPHASGPCPSDPRYWQNSRSFLSTTWQLVSRRQYLEGSCHTDQSCNNGNLLYSTRTACIWTMAMWPSLLTKFKVVITSYQCCFPTPTPPFHLPLACVGDLFHGMSFDPP